MNFKIKTSLYIFKYFKHFALGGLLISTIGCGQSFQSSQLTTGVDPDTRSIFIKPLGIIGSLVVKKAEWNHEKKKLTVEGKDDNNSLIVVADNNSKVLGSSSSDGEGTWRLEIKNLDMAPCEVEISSSGGRLLVPVKIEEGKCSIAIPIDETTPVVDTTPVEETTPVVDTTPIEETTPTVEPNPVPDASGNDVVVSNFRIADVIDGFVYFAYDVTGIPSDPRWNYGLFRRNGDNRQFERVPIVKTDDHDRVAHTYFHGHPYSPLRQCYKMEIYGYTGYGSGASSYRSNISNTVCYQPPTDVVPLHSIPLTLGIGTYNRSTREISFSWSEHKGSNDHEAASFLEENMATGQRRLVGAHFSTYTPGAQQGAIKILDGASGRICYELSLCTSNGFSAACTEKTNRVCVDVP